jgi:predicted RNA-binding protein YlqC (UPF0109 family)
MEPGAALQEFLEYVLSRLVTHPQLASVVHEVADGRHVYRIQLAEADIGRVIGRNGYTLSAIRSLLNAGATRNGIRVSLKVFQADGEKRGEQVA